MSYKYNAFKIMFKKFLTRLSLLHYRCASLPTNVATVPHRCGVDDSWRRCQLAHALLPNFYSGFTLGGLRTNGITNSTAKLAT